MEKDSAVPHEVVPETPVVVTQSIRESHPLAAKDTGVLVGTSLEQEYRLAKAYFSSGLMPRALNSTEKVLVALQLCRELNLPPLTSIGKIMIINGVPAIFGELPLALVMRSGLLVQIEEIFGEDEKGLPIASTCTVQRRGFGHVTRSFSVVDAKAAGLFKNDIWVKYTKRMLQCRARAWVLKDVFPDILGGIAIAEYDFNTTVDNGKIIGEIKTNMAEDLEKAYSSSDEDKEPKTVESSPG